MSEDELRELIDEVKDDLMDAADEFDFSFALVMVDSDRRLSVVTDSPDDWADLIAVAWEACGGQVLH